MSLLDILRQSLSLARNVEKSFIEEGRPEYRDDEPRGGDDGKWDEEPGWRKTIPGKGGRGKGLKPQAKRSKEGGGLLAILAQPASAEPTTKPTRGRPSISEERAAANKKARQDAWNSLPPEEQAAQVRAKAEKNAQHAAARADKPNGGGVPVGPPKDTKRKEWDVEVTDTYEETENPEARAYMWRTPRAPGSVADMHRDEYADFIPGQERYHDDGTFDLDSPRVTSQDRGRIGEMLALEYLRTVGGCADAEFYTRPGSPVHNNESLDMVGCGTAWEVKTSTASAKEVGMQFKVTFETSEEQEALRRAENWPPEQWAAWNADQVTMALERKEIARKELEQRWGKPVPSRTICVVLNHRKGLADINITDGIVKRAEIGEVRKGYEATMEYAAQPKDEYN